MPLLLEGEAEAGLNLYSRRPRGFTADDISTVETYSYHASKALRLAVRISQLAGAKAQLMAAMKSRTFCHCHQDLRFRVEVGTREHP